jgi:hypothetical protein
MNNNRFLLFFNRRRQAAGSQPEPEHRCPFPNCGEVFIPENNQPGACPYHRKLINDVVYILSILHTPPGPLATPVEVKKAKDGNVVTRMIKLVREKIRRWW